MKKCLFLLMIISYSVFSFADVIVTFNDERIEDVTIQSETRESIVYIENGVEKTILMKHVQGILYDDGRYYEFSQVFLDSIDNNNSTQEVDTTNFTEVDDIFLDIPDFLTSSEKTFLLSMRRNIYRMMQKPTTLRRQAKIVSYKTIYEEYIKLRMQGVGIGTASMRAYESAEAAYKSALNK